MGIRTQLWKPTVNSKYIEKHCAILVGFIGEVGGRYRLGFQCLNSDHAVSQGAPTSPGSGRTKKAQIKETGPASQLLLHGCKVSWMLPDHHSVLSRPDCGGVLRLLHSTVPVHWGQGQAY